MMMMRYGEKARRGGRARKKERVRE